MFDFVIIKNIFLNNKYNRLTVYLLFFGIYVKCVLVFFLNEAQTFPVIFQFGSYFGYSVVVQDLDKNGFDDIIVGAPFYSSFGTDNMYETGRVYIYYQNSKVRI